MNQGNRLWDEHLEQLNQIYYGRPSFSAHPRTNRTAVEHGNAEDALRGEWTAGPPGRLGRRLLAEIEPYLDFFATARS
jgi:hypothetical protein